MGKDTVWKLKISGAILTALGGFPVNREITDREAMRCCLTALKGGETLVLFPEGKRKSGSEIDNILEGAAYLAYKANVPLVPIEIGGTERAWGASMKLPRLTKVVLVVGEPIYPNVTTGESRPSRVSRSSLGKLSEELTKSLQSVFDEAQKEVGLL